MELRTPLFLLSLAAINPALAAINPAWAVLANECDSKIREWIWCDDFEEDRTRHYFGKTVLDRQPEVGLEQSYAAAFQFKAGQQHAGGFRVAFGRTPDRYFRPVDSGYKKYREIYWRMWVKVPQNWQGNGADKLSRATIIAGKDWSQAMIAHVWSGTDPGPQSHLLLIDPASGVNTDNKVVTTQYNDFPNLTWLGNKAGQFPLFSKENFGQWHCVEAYVKLNDPGESNGQFDLYINNQLDVSKSGINWIGDYKDYGINAVLFENYWNKGSPVDQTRYFDNIVISTERIGCGKKTS